MLSSLIPKLVFILGIFSCDDRIRNYICKIAADKWVANKEKTFSSTAWHWHAIVSKTYFHKCILTVVPESILNFFLLFLNFTWFCLEGVGFGLSHPIFYDIICLFWFWGCSRCDLQLNQYILNVLALVYAFKNPTGKYQCMASSIL